MRRPYHLLGLTLIFTAGWVTARGRRPWPGGLPVKGQPRESPPSSPIPSPPPTSPSPPGPTLIRNAIVLTATGERLEGGSLLLREGKIEAVGMSVPAPPDAVVLDATGKWVTPGVIDPHSHLGVFASPGIPSLSDGNEATNPSTAGVWGEHSIWPQDPGFGHARAGGVTALHTLPGSANLFGGRSVTVKPVPSRSYQGMKFPGAPQGLKMACGENPARVYASRGPSTRMGNAAGYRAGFIRGQEYLARWKRWKEEGDDPAKVPTRDLELESIAAALNGELLIHWHCYRADEMVTALDIAREFGFRIASFEHAVEGYKVRDYLAEHGVCANMWADWWGFKLEAYDAISQNIALVHEAGGCAVLHSDDSHGIQRLNQEAAKALRAAADVGVHIPHQEAIAWLTLNAARALGIDHLTGSLEAGKAADVVIWSGDPFSIYTKAEKVFVDGALLYDRSAPDPHLFGDFVLGILPREVGR